MIVTAALADGTIRTKAAQRMTGGTRLDNGGRPRPAHIEHAVLPWPPSNVAPPTANAAYAKKTDTRSQPVAIVTVIATATATATVTVTVTMIATAGTNTLQLDEATKMMMRSAFSDNVRGSATKKKRKIWETEHRLRRRQRQHGHRSNSPHVTPVSTAVRCVT